MNWMISRSFRTGDSARLTDLDELRADELPFERWFPVLEEHLDDFPKILVQLIEGFCLCVCARKPRHVPDQEAGFGVTFDHGRVSSHERSVAGEPSVERHRSPGALTLLRFTGANRTPHNRSQMADAYTELRTSVNLTESFPTLLLVDSTGQIP